MWPTFWGPIFKIRNCSHLFIIVVADTMRVQLLSNSNAESSLTAHMHGPRNESTVLVKWSHISESYPYTGDVLAEINARIHSGDIMVTLDHWSVYSLSR